MILKEEREKEQIRERHGRSLSAQRYDSKQSNYDAGQSRFTDRKPLISLLKCKDVSVNAAASHLAIKK